MRILRLRRALVDKIPKTIPDPGPIADIAELQTEDAQANTLRTLLETRSDHDSFWVFAFGSLMRNPDFAFQEKGRARVNVWHRPLILTFTSISII